MVRNLFFFSCPHCKMSHPLPIKEVQPSDVEGGICVFLPDELLESDPRNPDELSFRCVWCKKKIKIIASEKK